MERFGERSGKAPGVDESQGEISGLVKQAIFRCSTKVKSNQKSKMK